MTEVCCPTCQQPLTPTPKRVCYDCKLTISRRHKWTWQPRDGVITCVHRSCEHPESYLSLNEARERRLPPYNRVGDIKLDEAYALKLYREQPHLWQEGSFGPKPPLPPEPSGGTNG